MKLAKALFCALALLACAAPAFADPSGVICVDDNDCVGLTDTPYCIANHCSAEGDDGSSRPECTFDRDCPRGRPCRDGQCTRPGNSCTFDRDCPRGYACRSRVCLRR